MCHVLIMQVNVATRFNEIKLTHNLLIHVVYTETYLQLQSTNATYVFVNPHHLEAELLKEMWQNQEPHHPALQIMPDKYVPIVDLLQLQTTEIKVRIKSTNNNSPDQILKQI
ncbi:hypothetical protein Hanom_Chr03g00182921 [Helianthus anomalus]